MSPSSARLVDPISPSSCLQQSSIALIGELLFRITGISGKAEIEEEDDGRDSGAVDASRKVLLDILGKEKRDHVLSALYIVRQDAVNAVRTGSLHIWKALVQNTPRTLREILPSVINQVIALLASPGEEQRETASRTLGELCKKNGERILMEMIPILKASVSSTNPSMREGGCLAFSEILYGHFPSLLSSLLVTVLTLPFLLLQGERRPSPARGAPRSHHRVDSNCAHRRERHRPSRRGPHV